MRSHPITDKASLSGVRRRIRSELTGLGVEPSALFDCLVAVTEACTNALLHGVDDEGPVPQISWNIDGTEARFFVQDFAGQEWSMAAHPSSGLSHLSPQQAEERVGGYGLNIMRGLMDEVDIDVTQKGTVVSLVKRFP